MNGCKILIFGTVNFGGCGKLRVEKCYILLSVKCEDAKVNGCKSLHFITFSSMGGLKGMRWEILYIAECEM